MKTRQKFLITFLTLILIVFTLVVATGEDGYTPTDNEELYGTWVTVDYDTSKSKPAKFIYTSDGRWVWYWWPTDENPSKEGVYSILEKWTDSDGNIWYKLTSENILKKRRFYEILKISDSGNTLEQDCGYIKTIELNPEHFNYCIYTRQ